jgi:hypothetical protein
MAFWLDAKIAALTLVSFARGGYIPLRWLLPPEKYGERRSRARREEIRTEAAPVEQSQPADAVVAPRHARS